MTTPWELLGADDPARLRRLREVVDAFYVRVFRDPMIGFLFAGRDRARLSELEAQFTAAALGGPVRYEGRPMRAAHAASPILGGHFARRQQLLREVFEALDLPGPVREAWLAHNERLRAQVTRNAGSDCDHARAGPAPAGVPSGGRGA